MSKVIGRVYGEWTVLSVAFRDKNHNPTFVCRCSCGTKGEIPVGNLYSGRSTRCFACGRKSAAEKLRSK